MSGTVVYAVANTAVTVRFIDHGARVTFRDKKRAAVAHLTTDAGLKLCMLCEAMSALAGLLRRA